MESPRYKARVLTTIAGAIAKTDAERSIELLSQAIELAKGIDDPFYKADVVRAIASVIAKTDAERSVELFSQAIEIAKGIDDPSHKARALSAIAKTAVKLQDIRLGYEIALMNRDNLGKARTLSQMLKTWAILKNPALAIGDQEVH
jgi:hypothetical protein